MVGYADGKFILVGKGDTPVSFTSIPDIAGSSVSFASPAGICMLINSDTDRIRRTRPHDAAPVPTREPHLSPRG